ncbi:MAG: dephospho-CoA kinase [Gammaproteobacteria bacterium]|nr:dephospho-CoA kinase [Gammaproteobacteria bacterium]
MLRIGLTGGIGSGKTTVADMFAGHGVPVIDADEIARALVTPYQPAYDEIIEAFGRAIVDDDGNIDRDKLRQLVFDNTQRRQELEAILHPRVRTEIHHRSLELDAPYCVIVIPLLIEADQLDLVERVLVVDLDEEKQVQRVGARSRLSEAEVRKIIAAQIERSERLRHADDVIENNADLASLEAQVEKLHRRYLTLARE